MGYAINTLTYRQQRKQELQAKLTAIGLRMDGINAQLMELPLIGCTRDEERKYNALLDEFRSLECSYVIAETELKELQTT